MSALSKPMHIYKSLSQMPRFETLNEDVLHILLKELKGNLLALSTVSRRFRALCMPFIFENVYWDSISSTPFGNPPLNIWPYIHILTLAKDSKEWEDYFPLLSAQLPNMPQIHTILLQHLIYGVPPKLLNAVFSAPGLNHLDIMYCPYLAVEPYSAEVNPMTITIRSFAYRTRWITHRTVRYGLLKRTPEVQIGLQIEATSLWGILSQTHLTLESLYIPGETAQFGLMAELSWSNLNELTLFGLPPVTDIPLMFVLSRLPSLRTLHLEFAQLRSNRLFLVYPPGLSYDAPLNLTSLTLSWPSPEDQIFSHLPATLRHLAFRDSPRISTLYEFPACSGGEWLPILAAHDMLQILQASNISGLESLEVVYYADPGEAALLNFISTSLPSLQDLELHRFRPNRWFHDNDDISIDIISTTFSTCRSLRVLRVNPDFYEYGLYAPYSQQSYPFNQTAKTLVESILTLKKVALFYACRADDYNFYCGWSVWLVDRTNPDELILTQRFMGDYIINTARIA